MVDGMARDLIPNRAPSVAKTPSVAQINRPSDGNCAYQVGIS